MRPIESGTLLPSAARTAAVNSEDKVNEYFRGVKIFINATALAATPAVTFTIKEKDPVSGVYSTILASSALAATGHTVLTVYPGATAAANSVASQPLGRTWRVEVTVGDTDSFTYSVGYCYLV